MMEGQTELNLSDEKIGVQGMMALCKALRINTTVTTINLDGNNIGTEGAVAFAESLKINGTLTHLDLDENNIGPQGAIAFAEALKINRTLTDLSLRNNSIGDQGAVALAEALKINGVLTELSLGEDIIGPQGAVAIAEALKINGTLTHLNLDENNIGPQGAIAFAVALKINRTLILLRLDGNDIGDEGAVAFAEALKMNGTLTWLNLKINNIGPQGAVAFAEALKMNGTLTWLNLWDNNIGDEGAVAIAEALKTNRTLSLLNLYCNHIGDQGAVAFAEALEINGTLTELNLWNNNIGDEGAVAFAEALKINGTLSLLNFRDNNIGDQGVVALADALADALKINGILPELRGVDLNRFLHILSLPSEFSDKGNIEILAYLKELKASQSQEIYRMRVMLVGPGSAGETTLVHRLLTEEFVDGQSSMTDGVSMKEWKPEPSPGDGDGNFNAPLHLSLWDFGGQEVYLNSHPLLFSEKTLYLLVWNPRSGTTPQTLEEYVRNIRSRSKSGPILLVTTHSEDADGQSMRDIQQSLMRLQKFNCLQHLAVDSRTGTGIEALKSSLIGLVTGALAGYSRVLVPRWYLQVETRLREESEQKKRFSIDQGECLSICSSVWPRDPPHSSSDSDSERMKTVLELFHHWGVIYVLPPDPTSGSQYGGGDIVLNPQTLADVFKCVITCRPNTTSQPANRRLFEEGILVHDEAGFVWPEEQYDPRLPAQFLRLFHNNELAYALHDEKGDPSGRSLVPSLLPESSPLSEEELRASLLSIWDSSSPPIAELKVRNQMISAGFVKITFDSLLPNFFPKLLVRLRHLCSVSECSRRRCVVRVSERVRDSAGIGLVSGWSVCCVAEDKASNSLLVYPGGCSYDATAITVQAIRGLMAGSFAETSVEDVTFSAEEECFVKKKILRLLRQNQPATVPVDDDSGRDLNISLSFLSCLFPAAAPPPAPALPWDPALPAACVESFSALLQWSQAFQRSQDNGDKLQLLRYLFKSAPFFREYGLMLRRQPSVLWLVGRSPSSSSRCGYRMFAVSPGVTPCAAWEIVSGSEITISDHSAAAFSSGAPSSSPLSALFLSSLSLLFPGQQLPELCEEWVGLMDCRSGREAMAAREVDLFESDRNVFEELVWYSKRVMARQRQRGASAEEVREIVEEAVSDVTLLLSSGR